MMHSASDGLVIAARRPADEQSVIGRRRFLNVLPQAHGHWAVA
jgi:hypothetical protein